MAECASVTDGEDSGEDSGDEEEEGLDEDKDEKEDKEEDEEDTDALDSPVSPLRSFDAEPSLILRADGGTRALAR